MNKNVRNNYSRKIKLCEDLGALKFQRIVLLIEKFKFKFIKKVFPNFLNLYDKMCDKKRDRILKRVHSNVTKKRIIDHYNMQKIILRKEFYHEKSRNYHIDENQPIEFLKYLNWNKQIHKTGLKRDLIFLPVYVFFSIINPIFITLVIYDLFCVFINFECINIQNYNIYRIEEKEEKIRKIQDIKSNTNIKKYGKGTKVIVKSLKENNNIPTSDEVTSNVQTIEELNQIKRMIQSELDFRKSKKLIYGADNNSLKS